VFPETCRSRRRTRNPDGLEFPAAAGKQGYVTQLKENKGKIPRRDETRYLINIAGMPFEGKGDVIRIHQSIYYSVENKFVPHILRKLDPEHSLGPSSRGTQHKNSLCCAHIVNYVVIYIQTLQNSFGRRSIYGSVEATKASVHATKGHFSESSENHITLLQTAQGCPSVIASHCRFFCNRLAPLHDRLCDRQ
jgi:hypothetical protein